ncbi:hypothetical protein GCM10011338_22620 [Alteromonas lipolytica]|nr:hypothetical protein GCM10011338_22620 [Alteromonas lipolytica]
MLIGLSPKLFGDGSVPEMFMGLSYLIVFAVFSIISLNCCIFVSTEFFKKNSSLKYLFMLGVLVGLLLVALLSVSRNFGEYSNVPALMFFIYELPALIGCYGLYRLFKIKS